MGSTGNVLGSVLGCAIVTEWQVRLVTSSIKVLYCCTIVVLHYVLYLVELS